MFTDFVLNGEVRGDLASQAAEMRFETNLMRTFKVQGDRRSFVTVNTGLSDAKGRPVYRKMTVNEARSRGIPVVNANTSLFKQEWQMLDAAVLREARQRLRAWSDLAASNTFGGFNGMSKLILEHETMNDPGEAFVDFEGTTEGRTDSPKFQLEGLPLPITHSDFYFSARRLAVSRNSGTPLDTTMAEAAGRRVAEMIEKLTIGTVTGPMYGRAADYGRSPRVYGYTNFTPRLTKTNLTVPTGSNGSTIVADVLAMKDQMTAQGYFGPWMVYHSSNWDQYLDNDYRAQDSRTLRDRLKEIEGIRDVRRLDYLTPADATDFTLIMVQMTSDVARAVIGMPITTVQWEALGGMRLHFKVMAIMVPQLRATFSGQCGILHATTP